MNTRTPSGLSSHPATGPGGLLMIRSARWRKRAGRWTAFGLALCLAGLGLAERAIADDDGRWMFRFETRFGGAQNEYQLQFATGAGTDLASREAYPFGTPFAYTLFSSNPDQWSVFQLAARISEGDAKPTTGLAAALGLALLVGSFVQSVDEAGDRAAEEWAKNNPVVIEPIDLSVLDEIMRPES